MKIYFGFTVAGDRSSVEAARRIVLVLEEKGHDVLTKHLVQDDAWDSDRRISAQDGVCSGHEVASGMRLFYSRGFRFFLPSGFRNGLPAGFDFQKGRPVLSARS